ncbi:hypothetical protein CDAR_47961 [Caerostris darwini]|uniref:Ycf15 n=1 Tax=Caerostris darwini TaxID=1538125 RepID=A0AAV4VPT9_9ARAC|nr:hypothetical protein CDAR_47961 [Caerostris darwini]
MIYRRQLLPFLEPQQQAITFHHFISLKEARTQIKQSFLHSEKISWRRNVREDNRPPTLGCIASSPESSFLFGKREIEDGPLIRKIFLTLLQTVK